MTSANIFWTTTIVMAVGGLAILLIGKRRTRSEELHTVLHGIVPLIAACSYFAMATGQGAVMLHNQDGFMGERVFYFARYVDWAFTTPLLLVTLCMNAMHAGEKRAGAIAGAVLADMMMIATAFFFGASEVAWMKWTWFAISCAAFLGVYYVLLVPNMQANALERDDIRASYRRNTAVLSVIWLLYPVVLAIDPDGSGAVGETAGVLGIAVLDVVAKVAYGLMTVAADGRTAERDIAEATEAGRARTRALA